MAGQPATRLSRVILSELEDDEDLRERMLGDVMLRGKGWRKVLVSRLVEDRAVTYKAMLEWIDSHPDFVKTLQSAERFAAGIMVEETLGIADDVADDPASRKVRIDARWKLASKVSRLEWGEQPPARSDTPVVINIGIPSRVSGGRLIEGAQLEAGVAGALVQQPVPIEGPL